MFRMFSGTYLVHPGNMTAKSHESGLDAMVAGHSQVKFANRHRRNGSSSVLHMRYAILSVAIPIDLGAHVSFY